MGVVGLMGHVVGHEGLGRAGGMESGRQGYGSGYGSMGGGGSPCGRGRGKHFSIGVKPQW